MATKPDFAETLQDIRTNLLFQAEFLRRLDLERSEQAARKLDDLRVELKKLADSGGSH